MQEQAEHKLNDLLNNPELMQKIAALAQSLQTNDEKKPDSTPVPNLDLSMLQKVSALTQHGGIDSNQQALIKALSPYISHQRIAKLESAMRAAKIARVAISLFSGDGMKQIAGR